MRQLWSERIKQTIRPTLYRAMQRQRPMYRCPICEYQGPFKDKTINRAASLVRTDSKCPSCSSTERHRMMSLVIDEVFGNWNLSNRSMLHIAPEDCLRQMLDGFDVYHTADLEMKGVDFQADLQALPFNDATYDAILVSRVLTIPPDLSACLDEIHRVLKPGGVAIIAETYTHSENVEYGEMRQGRSRQIGISLLADLAARFARVDHYLSSRYPDEFQLNNRMEQSGVAKDDYPDQVRIPGVGFMDLVAVCHRSTEI